MLGVVGRQSGEASLEVIGSADGETLTGYVEGHTEGGAAVYTDEWGGYAGVPATGRRHACVSHGSGEWARDDDGDGVREVHCNTQEGIWTHVRTFLRRFYGVSKWDLAQYQAVFQWGYDIKAVTDEFLRILPGRPPSTDSAP